MNLTPEERRKIYEEEKERLEGSGQGPENRKPGGKVGKRVFIGCLGIIGGFLFLMFVGSLMSTSSKRMYDEPGLIADINASSQLRVLAEAKIIHQVQSFGSGVSVVVGPMFYSLSFDQKRSACQTVADVVGKTRGGDHFVLYDWQTDKKIGSWSEQYGLNLE